VQWTHDNVKQQMTELLNKLKMKQMKEQNAEQKKQIQMNVAAVAIAQMTRMRNEKT
jgi:hypothetical protein